MLKAVHSYWTRTNRFIKALILFFLVEQNWIPGGQVGFKCSDPALSYPFNGDTISMKWLTALCILLPIVVLLLVERSSNKVNPKQQAWSWYKEYMFGLLLNILIIQIFKKLVGSPRPHFFDTCMPEEAETCVGGEYVPSYSCTKAHWLTQSNKSFPSGHTSLAIHACIFLAYYLHQRCNSRSPIVLAVQASLVAAAVLCGASRVWDRRHHWWDVLAGAMFAAPILGYTISNLCKNFECRTANNDDAGTAKLKGSTSRQAVNAS